MTAHLLHLSSVDNRRPTWRLECVHPDGDQHWLSRNEPGENGDPDGGCWLLARWDEYDAELLDLPNPITTLPVPVRPSDDWDAELVEGTIIRDEVTP